MNITKQGLTLIQMFEGLRRNPYRDQAGKWTIGIGHLMKGEELQKKHPYWNGISEVRAYELLSVDLGDAAAAVRESVKVYLNDNQYTALAAFVFNVGIGAFRRSTMLKLLNALDYEGAAGQFIKWNKVTIDGKKQTSNGLTRRRAAEELVFRSPVVVWQPNHVMWAGMSDDPKREEFALQYPGAVVVMIAPTVEETYGPGTEGTAEAGPSADGQGER
jgi:lysozyme